MTAQLQKETNKKSNIIWLFITAYTVSYITRINYNAVISEMEIATGFSKTVLSMAVTGTFITYGIGQLVSGVLGDLLSPKKLVLCGLAGTVLMNLIIPFCTSPYQMLAVWSVNGFAQSFMWPPTVKLLTSLYSEEEYEKQVVKVSWGGYVGNMAVYAISPILISLFNWKAVFIFSALCGICMIFFWNKFSIDVKEEKAEKAEKASFEVETKEEKKAWKSLFSPLMIVIMVVIMIIGMLRDGITTWMPSLIADSYNLGSEISILTGAVLPLFAIFSTFVTSKFLSKRFKNPLLCSALIFVVGTLSTALLLVSTGAGAVMSVGFCALVTACMHGANLILVCILPSFFKKAGIVSTASGVLNFCVYVGSAVSAFGIALITDNFGWSVTLAVFVVASLVGTVLCALCIRPWRNRMNIEDNGAK